MNPVFCLISSTAASAGKRFPYSVKYINTYLMDISEKHKYIIYICDEFIKLKAVLLNRAASMAVMLEVMVKFHDTFNSQKWFAI